MAIDKETFPVSVVNYPVTNFWPRFDDLEDQVFYINEPPDLEKGVNIYQVLAIDHDLQDMFNLTYSCTLSGSFYQAGPFQESVIPLQGSLPSLLPAKAFCIAPLKLKIHAAYL